MAATTKAPTCSATRLVAVDANTGKYLWHFQAVHHDIWDYDLDTPPVLLEVNKDGKHIPAIAVMNKDALLYHPEPRHRRADLRRHRNAGAQITGRQRDRLADPAHPQQAAAAGALQLFAG